MIIASGVILGACGSSSDDKKSSDDKSSKDFTVAMVTDTGGVDDRSFNQSAWEGLQKFGKANDMEKVQMVTTTCNQLLKQTTKQT